MKKYSLIRKIALILCAIFALSMFASCSPKEKKFRGNMAEVQLEPGDTYAVLTIKGYEDREITIKLFPEAAPVGVEKFTDAANMGYYDGKTLHRLLKDVLAQGGALNMNGTDATIPDDDYFPVEFNPNARNFNGALCFAKGEKGNYRQFYIVTKQTPVDIDADAAALKEQIDANADLLKKDAKQELDMAYKALTRIPADIKERYLERGGLYELDGQVTVFGQVISGMDVLYELENMEMVAGNVKDDNNPALGKDGEGMFSRPYNDVFIDGIKIVTVEPEEEEAPATDKKKKKK